MTGEGNNKQLAEHRRKRVRRIKNTIILMIIMILLVPTLLSVFLMYKVMNLEKKLDYYVAKEFGKDDYASDSSVVKAVTKKPGSVPQDITKATATPLQSPLSSPKIEKKKVYLTFDDGPSQYTKEILDILKAEKIKATFFVIGHEDEFSKKMYRRIVKEGHTLAMHSYSHIYSEIYKSPNEFEKDLTRLQKYLTKVTGKKPKYYRFPGGSSNDAIRSLDEYVKKLEKNGVTYMDWNVVNGDGLKTKLSKTQLVQNVMKGISEFDVSVVQMHDSSDKKMTVSSIKLLISKIKSSGYQVLPINEKTKAIQHIQ